MLDVVTQAELKIAEQTNRGELDKEYLGVEGNPAFILGAREFVLGADSPAITSGRVSKHCPAQERCE